MKTFLVAFLFASSTWAAKTEFVTQCYGRPTLQGSHLDQAHLCAHVSTEEEVDAVTSCYNEGPALSGSWSDMARLCARVKNEKHKVAVIECFKKGGTLPGTWTEIAALCSHVEE